MEDIRLGDRDFQLYLSEEQLLPEIERMAAEIIRDLGDKDPLFICILNGAFMFSTELFKAINREYELAFAKYSSYQGMSSSGHLTEEIPPQVSLEGRTVVILEDLVDTGFTLSRVVDLYKERGAKDIKIAVMLSKPNAPKVVNIIPDYIGLEIPNDFIVGHGLDYNGKGRFYKDIYVVK